MDKERREILLKEYEACQQGNQAQISRYWTIVSIFISINIPIISGLGIWALSNTDFINQITNTKNFLIILPILLLILGAIFIIIQFLELSMNRIHYIVQSNDKRICEIEINLGMWKELPIYILDKWNKIRKKLKYKTKLCESQNNEIWEQVWKELSIELPKVDILYNEKTKIEEILNRKRSTHAISMEYKVAYVFWGISSLWILVFAYFLVSSSSSSFGNWSNVFYFPVIGIYLDYRNIRNREQAS